MRKTNPPIERNSVRHGKAAATQLLVEFHSRPPLMFEDHDTEGKTRQRETVQSYLDGFTCATARARYGFLVVLADALAGASGGAIPSDPAEYYAKPRYNGGRYGPTGNERRAHARAWLRSGRDGR